jgi:hypothetical protein
MVEKKIKVASTILASDILYFQYLFYIETANYCIMNQREKNILYLEVPNQYRLRTPTVSGIGRTIHTGESTKTNIFARTQRQQAKPI